MNKYTNTFGNIGLQGICNYLNSQTWNYHNVGYSSTGHRSDLIAIEGAGEGKPVGLLFKEKEYCFRFDIIEVGFVRIYSLSTFFSIKYTPFENWWLMPGFAGNTLYHLHSKQWRLYIEVLLS